MIQRTFSLLVVCAFALVLASAFVVPHVESRSTSLGVYPERIAATHDASTSWVSFDGIDDAVVIEDNDLLDDTSAMTWSFWVKQHQYQKNAVLLGKYATSNGNRAFIIRTTLNNSIGIVLSQDGTTLRSYSSYSVRKCGVREDGEWVMITLTYNGSQVIYYRNGVRCDSDTVTISKIHNSPQPLQIGSGYGGAFNGSVDEVRVYRATLAPEQVKRLYEESVHGEDRGISVPVLLYHQIDPSRTGTDVVSPAAFKNQMDYLAEQNFNPITVDDFRKWQQGSFILPEKPVVLFFDDGWMSVYEHAVPILDDHGFFASVAVVSDYANRIRGGPAYMHWPEYEELQSRNWSFESHSMTHYKMLTLSSSAFRKELIASKNNLTENLGITPKTFVFPFHNVNTTYTDICSEYYDICWTTSSDIRKPLYNYLDSDGATYRGVQRITVANRTTLNEFKLALGKDTDMTAVWMFDEGTGSSAADTSGNGLHGVLKNGAYWEDESSSFIALGDGVLAHGP